MPLRPQPPAVFRLALAPLILLGAGCAPESSGDDPPTTLIVEAVPIPALPGSGEPRVSPDGDGAVISWLEPATSDSGAAATTERWRLRMLSLGDDGAGEPHTVAAGDDWFVNWADFPSVVPIGDGTLLAHWLQREGTGSYDYGIRIARSSDGGASWSEPSRPHDDGPAGEHGFASIFPIAGGGGGLVWLDGRRFAAGEEIMTLRARTFDRSGAPGAETLVDESICDCCQTDAAVTSDGVVVVYRDRTEGEVRDIYATSLIDGRWTEGRPVHADGWVIAACPVNGPAVDARGADVAVAWFTAPGDSARVQVAFSGDGGATFGAPARVDGGNPGGRVDVVLLEDGGAAVSWIERVAEDGAEGGAQIRVRRVARDGALAAPAVLSDASAERSSGFPRMALDGRGRLVFAWTDVSGAASVVRVARIAPASLPTPDRR